MRQRTIRAVGLVALAALALAACGSSGGSQATSSPSPYGGPTPTTTAPAAAVPTISLATVAAVGDKRVLVDSSGMTLYVWDNDTTPGRATCTGACATAWPPLYVTGTPTYGAGLDASKFSTVTGPDGKPQLAVNGKPLYLWAADTKPGEATGEGVNGFYVVGADGTKITGG